jgi:hypothetical protein
MEIHNRIELRRDNLPATPIYEAPFSGIRVANQDSRQTLNEITDPIVYKRHDDSPGSVNDAFFAIACNSDVPTAEIAVPHVVVYERHNGLPGHVNESPPSVVCVTDRNNSGTIQERPRNVKLKWDYDFVQHCGCG